MSIPTQGYVTTDTKIVPYRVGDLVYINTCEELLALGYRRQGADFRHHKEFPCLYISTMGALADEKKGVVFVIERVFKENKPMPYYKLQGLGYNWDHSALRLVDTKTPSGNSIYLTELI